MDDPIYNRIQDYVSGKLSGDDLRRFEQQIDGDPELAERVAFEKNFQEVVRMEPGIEAIRQGIQAAKGQQTDHRKWLWGLLALVALGGLLYFLRTPSVQPQEKIRAMLEQQSTIGSLSRDGAGQGLLDSAIQQYNGGQFAMAAQQLERYLQSTPNDYTARLYAAQAHRQAKQFSAAESHLRQLVAAADDHLLGEQARWELALSLWQSGQQEESRELLQLLTKGGGDRAEEAGSFLEAIQ